MPTCRSCLAEVVFVPSAKTGRPMILDAKPAKGVLVIDQDSPDFVGEARWDAPRVAKIVDVYTDHHATCPEAKAWTGRTRATVDPERDRGAGILGQMNAPGSWPVADS